MMRGGCYIWCLRDRRSGFGCICFINQLVLIIIFGWWQGGMVCKKMQEISGCDSDTKTESEIRTLSCSWLGL